MKSFSPGSIPPSPILEIHKHVAGTLSIQQTTTSPPPPPPFFLFGMAFGVSVSCDFLCMFMVAARFTQKV